MKCAFCHEKPIYAKGLCRNCHARQWRCGTPEYKIHKCFATGCNKSVCGRDYCEYHKRRIEKGQPLTAKRRYHMYGKSNPRWNGGTSEYKNHAEFKRNRLIVLKNNNKCRNCEEEATVVHHENHDTSDHRIENLIPYCHRCHSKLHSELRGGRNSYSKYKAMYGLTLKEISDKTGLSYNSILYWNKKNPQKIINALKNLS